MPQLVNVTITNLKHNVFVRTGIQGRPFSCVWLYTLNFLKKVTHKKQSSFQLVICMLQRLGAAKTWLCSRHNSILARYEGHAAVVRCSCRTRKVGKLWTNTNIRVIAVWPCIPETVGKAKATAGGAIIPEWNGPLNQRHMREKWYTRLLYVFISEILRYSYILLLYFTV